MPGMRAFYTQVFRDATWRRDGHAQEHDKISKSMGSTATAESTKIIVEEIGKDNFVELNALETGITSRSSTGRA